MKGSLIFFSSELWAPDLNLNTPVGDYSMILIWAEYSYLIKTMKKNHKNIFDRMTTVI